MYQMKKCIFLVFIVLSLNSCSKNYYFNRDQVKLSNELKEILNADQSVRNYNTMVKLKYRIRDLITVCDSLYSSGNADLIRTYDFSKIPSEGSQIAKLSETAKKNYDEDNINGIKLMRYIDNINRAKLYKIIKKYGCPSFYNRKWKDTTNLRVGITVVLTHFNFETPQEKKLLKLMVKEYLAGRVEEGEMANFLWSVDDRKGKPYDYKINIEDWKKRVGL